MISHDYKKVIGAVVCGFLVYIIAKPQFNKHDAEGFDKEGFDKFGYDRNGFNKSGYNRAGFDSLGYDKDGFDMRGIDKEGYNRKGYDSQGYRRNGFDSDGFNREGVDWQGYFKNGYNLSGLDRAKFDRHYYAEIIKKLRFRLKESYQQLQQGKFRYALYDARTVLEKILKLIVQHSNGVANGNDSIFKNMKICEKQRLLGDNMELMARLHEVRHICNFNGHEFTAEEKMNHKKVYFVIMQIKDLLNIAENILVCE